MKHAITLFALVAILFAGCKTQSAATYKSAAVIEATADRAMVAWVDYFKASSPEKQIELAPTRSKIDYTYNKFRATMNLVYSIRANYVAGAATQTEFESALVTAAAVSGEVLGLVNLYLPANKQVK